VSEFFYRDLYEQHRFTEVVVARGRKNLVRQKGSRERMLCSACESFLANEYEDYGARAFRRIKSQTRNANGPIVVADLNYGRFKLCMLAQLWRMSQSMSSHWQHVVLPSDVQQDILMMLRSGDPREVSDYGIMVEAVFADDGEHFDAFMPPIPIKIWDFSFVLASFAGFSWYYALERIVTEPRLQSYFVTVDGSLKIGATSLRDAWHIQMFGDELEAIGKLPRLACGSIRFHIYL